jgi:hypothetical protein
MSWNGYSVPDLESRLVGLESKLSDLRAEQVVMVHELDKAQAPQTDGSRSLLEWVQSHMDVSESTARGLVYAARHVVNHMWLWDRFVAGNCTFARTVAAMKLAESGADRDTVLASFERDLAGVARATAQQRRVTSHDERKVFGERYFLIQPSLDEAQYRMWGQLPGVAGRSVEKAIHDRADELHRTAIDVPSSLASSRSQRQADALVAMAQDSLTGDRPEGTTDSPHVTVFVDATRGKATRDNPTEMAAEIAAGPRVGPDALEQMLCTGTVSVVSMDGMTPVATSPAARAIPPALRHAILHRDQGCTIDGCASRYRLQPHHIRRWADGGHHGMSNLTTLCWFHHHVAIHGQGYEIDPHTPPFRRRLRRQRTGTDPPRS